VLLALDQSAIIHSGCSITLDALGMDAQIKPIQEEDLAVVCEFLHAHFNPSVPVREWRAGLQNRWSVEAPNYGFMIVHDGSIAGVIGAIYADREIGGSRQRFCNITSWYVFPEHRAATLKMLLALLKQKNLHFTNFSANEAAAEILERLKFRRLDASVLVFPNLPLPGSAKVLTGLDAIAERLDGEARKLFDDHRDCPQVEHLCLISGAKGSHVIFRRARLHGIPMIKVLHVSDSSAFLIGLPAVGRHFLLHRGIPLTSIESRLLDKKPRFAMLRTNAIPKLVRSETLDNAQFDNAYSELMCFDI
jgi:hypothetical protein